MTCFIVRWLMSHALDTDSAFPGFVTRHVCGCLTCRNYAYAVKQIEVQLIQDGCALPRPAALGPQKAPEMVLFAPRAILGAAFCVMLLAVGLVAMTRTKSDRLSPPEAPHLSLSAAELAQDQLGQYLPADAFSQELDAWVEDGTTAINNLIACTGWDTLQALASIDR